MNKEERKVITAKQLLEVCQKAIDAGQGDAPVYFDSEAASFKVHMVRVSSAHFHDDVETSLGCFINLGYEFNGQIKAMSTYEDRKQLCDYLMENLA